MTETEVKLAGPTECLTFEPQAWRKTICKNCFQPPEKHTMVADLESSSDGSLFRKAVSRQNSSEPGTPESIGKLVDGFKSESRSSISPDKKAVSIKEKYEQLERDKFQPKEFSNTLPRTKYKKGISPTTEKCDTVESLSGTDNIKTNIPPPTLPKQYKKMPDSGSEMPNLQRSKFGSVENILDTDNGELVSTKQKMNKFGSMENIFVQDNRKELQKNLSKSNFDGSFENIPEGYKVRASDVKPLDKRRDILNKLDEFTNEVKSGVTSKIGQTTINKPKNGNVNITAIEANQTDDKQDCDNKENNKLRQSNDITTFKSEVEVTDSKPVCIDTNAKLKHDPHSKFALKLSMPENEKQSSLRQSKEKLLSPTINSHAIKTVPDTMSNISKDKLNTEANHNHIIVNDKDKNTVSSLKHRSQSLIDADNTGSDKDTCRPNEINALSKTSMLNVRDNIKSSTPEKDGSITWKLKHQLKTPSPETEKKPDFKLKIQLPQSIPEVQLSVVDKENTIKTLKRSENDQLISPKPETNEIPILQQTNQPKSPTKEADKRLELQTKEQSKLSSLVSPDIDKNSNLKLKDQTKSKSNSLIEGKRIGVNFKDQFSSFGKAKLDSSKWEKSSVNHTKQDTVITDNESKNGDYLSKSKKAGSEESKSIKIDQTKEDKPGQSTGEQQVLKTPKVDAEKQDTSKYSKSTLDTKKEKDKGTLNTKEKDELTTQCQSSTTDLKPNKNKNENDLTPKVEKSLLVPNKDDKSFGLRSNLKGVKEHGRKDSENISTKSKFELPSLKSSKSEPTDAKTLRTRAHGNITDSKDESKVKGNKFKSSKCEMKETIADTQGGLVISDKTDIPKLQYSVSGDHKPETKTDILDIKKPSISSSIFDQNQDELNINNAKPNECILNKTTMNTADNTLEKYTYINGDTSSQSPEPDTGQNIETEINATYVKCCHDFPTNDSVLSENETFGSKETDTLKRKNVGASETSEPHFDTLSTNIKDDASSTSQETCADINANDNLPLYVDTQVFTRSRNTITEDNVLTSNHIDTYDNRSTGSGTGFSSTKSSFETKHEESENVPNGDISDVLQLEKFNVQLKTLDSNRKINMELSESDIEKLKSELLNMTERCQNLETENEMLREDLSKTEVSAADLRKHMDEVDLTIKGLQCQLNSSDDRCIKLESENINLKNNIKTSQMKLQTKEADEMDERLSTREKLMDDMMEENEQLKQEITELKAEMEEMYDTFRDQEAEEFREIQKELEYTAKNCRILQFKMRKLERQCHQLEQDKKQVEDRLRTLQNQFQDRDAVAHIHCLEDELRTAKDVSVRLRDDLDLMEDKISKVDEENHHLTELLEQSDRKQFRLELEVDKLRDKIIELRTELRARNEADDGEPRKE